MEFFRRFLEGLFIGLFINLVWWILQAVVAAIPVIAIISSPELFSNGFLCLLIVTLTIFLSCLIWYFGRNYYPRLSWDVIHGHNTYTLSYMNRKSAHCERSIEAIPLRKHIDAFKDGEYRWSGSSSIPSILESGDFELTYEETHGCTNYTVIPKMIVRAYKRLHYTPVIKLEDANETATPSHFIYIKRPTKKITLILKMAVGIPICNVRFESRTTFGEERKLIYKEGYSKQENGYNIYTFTVRRPKLSCEYEIRWDWCA